MSFEGKVILITGASSGIGAACAEYFAKEGALLSLVGRNPDKFAKVIENIANSGVEVEPLVIYADVSTDAERIISETIEKYGRLDILINNAGFSIVATIENATMNDFDAIMGTNVRGAFEITKLAIPSLVESKGNIINISSVCGIKPYPNLIIYAMSKACLDQFTKCLAMDLAEKGVRVNSVNPGFIDTDFHTSWGVQRNTEAYQELVAKFAASHPIGRVGTTEDCVNAISIFAKDSASFLTGVIFPVDGGISAK